MLIKKDITSTEAMIQEENPIYDDHHGCRLLFGCPSLLISIMHLVQKWTIIECSIESWPVETLIISKNRKGIQNPKLHSHQYPSIKC